MCFRRVTTLHEISWKEILFQRRSPVKLVRGSLILGLFLLATFPVLGADKRSGAGFGINSGTVDSDILPDELDFVGFTVFYKWGFTDTWGLFFSYREMEDDENLFLGEEDEYTQFGVHAVYMWRAGKRVRPHVKFGLAHTDFEAKIPGLPLLSDSDVTISVGGGLEAGSEKIAFFADFDYTEPEITLLGVSQDMEIGNLTLGIIFKF